MVRVGLWTLSDPSHSPSNIVVQVGDDGVGLSEMETTELFVPFYQNEMSSLMSRKGTGLGLPFSHRVAQGHGGDIAVVSEKGALNHDSHSERRAGKGTVFTLWIPTEHMSASCSRERFVEPRSWKRVRHRADCSVLDEALHRVGAIAVSNDWQCWEVTARVHPSLSTSGNGLESGSEGVLRRQSPPSTGSPDVARQQGGLPAVLVVEDDLYAQGAVFPAVDLVQDCSPSDNVVAKKERVPRRQRPQRSRGNGRASTRLLQRCSSGQGDAGHGRPRDCACNPSPLSLRPLHQATFHCWANGQRNGEEGNAGSSPDPTQPEDISDFVNHGADEVLTKPLVLKDLQMILGAYEQKAASCSS